MTAFIHLVEVCLVYLHREDSADFNETPILIRTEVNERIKILSLLITYKLLWWSLDSSRVP